MSEVSSEETTMEQDGNQETIKFSVTGKKSETTKKTY